MNHITPDGVIAHLESLRQPAPPELADRVLAASGLVDRCFETRGPIGPILVAYSDHGITGCVPASDAGLLEERLGRRVIAVDIGDVPVRIRRAVERTVATGKTGPLPLDLGTLTDFQRSVLEKTAEIPPGEVRPYGWVAKEIGRPGAVRAVGSALGVNPVPVLIPCHRVVRSDGLVGNYAFGPAIKERLLEGEGLDPGSLEQLAAAGIRFVGSDTTNIYCFPTCRHARRVTARHRVDFRSRDTAEASGFRACKVCRPAA